MKTILLLLFIGFSGQIVAQSLSASQIVSALNSQNNSKIENELKSLGFKLMSKEDNNGLQSTSYMKSSTYGAEHLEITKNHELFMFVYKPETKEIFRSLKEIWLTSEFEYSYSYKNSKFYETSEMRIGLNEGSGIISFFVPLKN